MAFSLLHLNKPTILGIDLNDKSILIVSLIKNKAKKIRSKPVDFKGGVTSSGQMECAKKYMRIINKGRNIFENSSVKSIYQLEKFAEIDLPQNAIKEKEIKNIEAVANCLKEGVSMINQSSSKKSIVNKFKFPTLKYSQMAAVALPDSAVMTKVISVEKNLSELDLEAQIVFEASKNISYPMHEVQFDYFPLKNSAYHGTQQDFFVAAARLNVVESYMQVLKLAGLVPKYIDVESFAIQKACMNLVDSLQQNENCMLIHVTSARTTIILCENNIPVFTRCEVIIQQHLVQTIKHILQFYHSMSEQNRITKIILSGELTVQDNLSLDLIKQDYDLELIIVEPLEKIKYHPHLEAKIKKDHQPASSLMIALGLALRSFD